MYYTNTPDRKQVWGKNGEPIKWFYCPYTKNERTKSTKRGRHFPINNAIRELLDY